MNPPATIISGIKERESQAPGHDSSLVWEEVKRIFEGFENSVLSKEIATVFTNLRDKELIEALEKTRWTGRPGYPIEVLWHTIVLSYILNIPTIQELRRRLDDPYIAFHCGIHHSNQIPMECPPKRIPRVKLEIKPS